MKKILLLIITLLTFSFCFSQKAPGYMGKKLVPSYSMGFAPSFFNPNKNGEKGILNFNLFHQFRLDYVNTRKSSTGIGFESYSTGINFNNIYRNNEREETIFFHNHGVLNVKGIQLYKSFYSNAIAPMGKRHSIGIKVLFSSIDFSDMLVTKQKDRKEATIYEIKKGGTSSDFGFMYSYSSSRIIADKIVLSFGLDFNNIFSAHFKYFDAFVNSNKYDGGLTLKNESEEQFLNDKAKQRVFSSQFLMIKLGIGFLAY